MLEQIFLIDRSPDVVDAWNREFFDVPTVMPLQAEYFSQQADAIVSPANSFGIMDGGLDAVIRSRLGDGIESRVQAAIQEEYFGELPVGSSVIVETLHTHWPFLVCAPGMRVPENVAHTINAYLAFRSVLNSIRRHNLRREKPRIRTLLCSGFCTGVGGMLPEQCAYQMRLACANIENGGGTPLISEMHESHRQLTNKYACDLTYSIG